MAQSEDRCKAHARIFLFPCFSFCVTSARQLVHAVFRTSKTVQENLHLRRNCSYLNPAIAQNGPNRALSTLAPIVHTCSLMTAVTPAAALQWLGLTLLVFMGIRQAPLGQSVPLAEVNYAVRQNPSFLPVQTSSVLNSTVFNSTLLDPSSILNVPLLMHGLSQTKNPWRITLPPMSASARRSKPALALNW